MIGETKYQDSRNMDKIRTAKANGKEVDQITKAKLNPEFSAQEIDKLKQVCTQVCEDYNNLVNRYNVEKDSTQQALSKANKWYKQNRQLKRTSAQIMEKMKLFTAVDINLDEVTKDAAEETPEEQKENEQIEVHKRTIQELQDKIVDLMAELRKTKSAQDERSEQILTLQKTLDRERLEHEDTRQEVQLLNKRLQQFQRASVMAVEEIQDLHRHVTVSDQQLEMTRSRLEEADREKKSAARQSALLMAQVSSDERLTKALEEIQKLTLENEKQMDESKNQLLEQQNCEHQLLVMNKKVNDLQKELDTTENRATKGDGLVRQLQDRVRDLELKLREYETTPVAPPPPPPPPMPPAPTHNNPISALMAMIGISRGTKKIEIAPEVADPRKVAMNDMVQQLKRGDFQLRRVDSCHAKMEKLTPSPAVGEMMHLLSSFKLKRSASQGGVSCTLPLERASNRSIDHIRQSWCRERSISEGNILESAAERISEVTKYINPEKKHEPASVSNPNIVTTAPSPEKNGDDDENNLPVSKRIQRLASLTGNQSFNTIRRLHSQD